MSRLERRIEPHIIYAPEFPDASLINEAIDRFQKEKRDAGNPLSPHDADRLRLGLAFLTHDAMSIERAAGCLGMPMAVARSRFKLPCSVDALDRCFRLFEEVQTESQRQNAAANSIPAFRDGSPLTPAARENRVIKKRASPQGRRYGPVTKPMESGIMPQITETDKDKLVITLFEKSNKGKPSFAEVAAELKQQAGDINPITPADIQQAKRRVYRLEKYGDIEPKTKKRAHQSPEETTRFRVNATIDKNEKAGKKITTAKIAKKVGVTPARVRQLRKERSSS